ncbi:hypothetical protein NDU88_003500 [Pleurodeles waltl]|uniref:Uncharacterized protein n=1 Tax=Pleurodeles waltl TaxID=8319 RepID=A0AAV7LH93_PLEWA|nr:hypothetical protein NDU88_003500 [Pleurodeles waltl]
MVGEDTGEVCMDVVEVSASDVCVLLGVVMMLVVDIDVVHAGVSVDVTGWEVEEEEEEGETVEAVDVIVSANEWCLCECLWDEVWCLCLPETLLGVVLCACSSGCVLGMGWGEWDWEVIVEEGMVETGTMAAIREEARAWIDLCWAANPL